MNISLILAHPNPKSFNHAMAAVAHETLIQRERLGLRTFNSL